jgi:hypothetical protein
MKLFTEDGVNKHMREEGENMKNLLEIQPA